MKTIEIPMPGHKVVSREEWLKARVLKSTAAEFTFKPDGDQTVVTWSMSGKNNFIAKAMCLFMNMDQMVGGQFEKGLAAMKSIVEAAPKQ